jgi:hypothetical protein
MDLESGASRCTGLRELREQNVSTGLENRAEIAEIPANLRLAQKEMEDGTIDPDLGLRRALGQLFRDVMRQPLDLSHKPANPAPQSCQGLVADVVHDQMESSGEELVDEERRSGAGKKHGFRTTQRNEVEEPKRLTDIRFVPPKLSIRLASKNVIPVLGEIGHVPVLPIVDVCGG